MSSSNPRHKPNRTPAHISPTILPSPAVLPPDDEQLTNMNTSSCPLDRTSSPPPDSNQFSSASVGGELNDMILNSFCLGALLPISIALVLTGSHLWKKPVFILNACAILCAIAFGGITAKNTVSGSINSTQTFTLTHHRKTLSSDVQRACNAARRSSSSLTSFQSVPSPSS